MARHHTLAQFELLVMAAVVRLRGEAFATRIRREIEERSGRPAAMGAVYAAVARLEEKGLLRHRLTESQPVPGGRARKRFQLTRAGERALNEAASVLTRMLDGLLPASSGTR